MYGSLLPRAHAQGGNVISRVVIVVSKKIAISRVLGVWATRKYDKSIEFGEKLASVRFKLKDTLHKRDK